MQNNQTLCTTARCPSATYIWYFKPDETQKPPFNIIRANARFIKKFALVTPAEIKPLLGMYDAMYGSDLENTYESVPRWIVKADIARLLYVLFNGSFYFDTDCSILKPFEFNTPRMVLFTEAILESTHVLNERECKDDGVKHRIANYAFGTNTKHHPFIKDVIEEVIIRVKTLLTEGDISDTDVLWASGPDAITTVYHRTRQTYPGILVMGQDVLNHTCSGSWRR